MFLETGKASGILKHQTEMSHVHTVQYQSRNNRYLKLEERIEILTSGLWKLKQFGRTTIVHCSHAHIVYTHPCSTEMTLTRSSSEMVSGQQELIYLRAIPAASADELLEKKLITCRNAAERAPYPTLRSIRRYCESERDAIRLMLEIRSRNSDSPADVHGNFFKL